MSATRELAVTRVAREPGSPALVAPDAVMRDCGLRNGDLVRVSSASNELVLPVRAAQHGAGVALSETSSLNLDAAEGQAVSLHLPRVDFPPEAALVQLVQLAHPSSNNANSDDVYRDQLSGSLLNVAARSLLGGCVVSPGRVIEHSWRHRPEWVLVQHAEPALAVVGPHTVLEIVQQDPAIAVPKLVTRAQRQIPSVQQWCSTIETQFAGYPSLVQQLVELCHEHLSTPNRGLLGVLLHGQPGVGKSALADALAAGSGLHVQRLNAVELQASQGWPEHELASLLESATSQAPCVVVLEELQSIAPRELIEGSPLSTTLGHQLDALAGQGSVVLLGTTVSPENVDLALLRTGRFGHELQIATPSRQQRMSILQAMLKECPLDVEHLREVAAATSGYVGADLYGMCVDAVGSARPNPPELEHFKGAAAARSPALLSATAPRAASVSFASLAGLDEVVGTLRAVVLMPLQPECEAVFKRLGVHPPRGVLLHGPPGCGKSMLAEAVAHELGSNFVEVQAPLLLSKVVGGSEHNLAAVFQRARAAAPCVLFIDQLEALAPVRSAANSSSSATRLLSLLLTELDGMKQQSSLEARVVVLAATSRLDLVDHAAVRSGRIELLLEVPLPGVVSRRDILRLLSTRMPVQSEGLEGFLDALAEQTEGLSGAQLCNMCQEAALQVLRGDIHAQTIPHTAIQTQCTSMKRRAEARFRKC